MAIADGNAAETLGAFLMLGVGKTGTVRASATASSARSQAIYQRYAAVLYRQALLTLDDTALAEHVVCAPVVNESALAAMPGRGDIRASRVPGIHPREMADLLRAVLRKLTSSPSAAVEGGDHVRGPAAGGQ
jgi:hypothetical protein